MPIPKYAKVRWSDEHRNVLDDTARLAVVIMVMRPCRTILYLQKFSVGSSCVDNGKIFILTKSWNSSLKFEWTGLMCRE